MVTADTFNAWKILEKTADRVAFELTYDYPASPGETAVREVKRITLTRGQRLFHAVSTFTRNGQPLPDLPVAIGVTTHDGKAVATLEPANRWIACWEVIDGDGLGTGATLAPEHPIETRELPATGKDTGHALILTRTAADGTLHHAAGYGWARAGTIKTAAQWAAFLTAFTRQPHSNHQP
jgi:hypothetical protein